VALKFLPAELTRDAQARDRFVQEAQAASALDHPNICTIFEIDTTPDGQMFLSMAYYKGETLKQRLERAPMTEEEAVDVALNVAQGLAKAHASGIVHRDIKPANLMITADGVVKILDFGLAKLSGAGTLTRTGMVPGTVSYIIDGNRCRPTRGPVGTGRRAVSNADEATSVSRGP
jgi:serine/threonine protein kinase